MGLYFTQPYCCQRNNRILKKYMHYKNHAYTVLISLYKANNTRKNIIQSMLYIEKNQARRIRITRLIRLYLKKTVPTLEFLTYCTKSSTLVNKHHYC